MDGVNRPPSGRQYEIARDDQHAVVTEVGAGLRSYTVDSRPAIDGYALDALCPSGRGQILAPWPNRLGSRFARPTRSS